MPEMPQGFRCLSKDFGSTQGRVSQVRIFEYASGILRPQFHPQGIGVLRQRLEEQAGGRPFEAPKGLGKGGNQKARRK
jgi:hypothetical protein